MNDRRGRRKIALASHFSTAITQLAMARGPAFMVAPAFSAGCSCFVPPVPLVSTSF